MKLTKILENDRMAAFFDKKYTKIRDTLSRKEIAFLVRMVKRKKAKKGMTGIPEDLVAKFQDLNFANDRGQPNIAVIEPFLKWLINNPSKEMDFIDKRSDANDSLTRVHLKRDNDWTDPMQKRARKVIKSLSDEEKEAFRKVHSRYLNKRTKNLAKSWGDTPATELIALQKRGILDDDGNLTDFGEFAVKYYMAFKDDPDGLDRVTKDKRVGNYGTARKRRDARMNKVINK